MLDARLTARLQIIATQQQLLFLTDMPSNTALNPESDDFQSRPNLYLGQHDSDRTETLTDEQYNQVLSTGVSTLVTA